MPMPYRSASKEAMPKLFGNAIAEHAPPHKHEAMHENELRFETPTAFICYCLVVGGWPFLGAQAELHVRDADSEGTAQSP